MQELDTAQAQPASPEVQAAPAAATQSTASRSTAGYEQARSALSPANPGSGYAAQAAALTPVQRRGGDGTAGVHQAAAAGTRGSGGSLPHVDRIQASFGQHDVSGVRAHAGSEASAACASMGASAYATGEDVAFQGAPSLHTAAHEAAHVIQQRSGVSLSGGVGRAGDSYEQHADSVADAVVAGRSAEELLGGGGGGGGGGAVQRHDQDGDCSVTGPPAKTAAATAQNVSTLEAWLTSHICGHAQAATTYTFYDVVDGYLGPWGESGYLIGYGRHYNILFSTHRTLMADPVAAQWVWRTSIYLQEAVRDFIMGRFQAGTLGTLTEGELRAAAFASHAQAYSDGGLSMVASAAPELIPVISVIPGAEFNPLGDTFGATVSQVFQTVGLILPTVVGNMLAGMAGPAHTGVIGRAMDQDRRRMQEQMALSRGMGNLEQGIQRGYFDSIRTLQQITDALNAAQYPDTGFAQYAQRIIQQADEKKRELARSFQSEIEADPSLGNVYDTTQPGWRAWLAS